MTGREEPPLLTFQLRFGHPRQHSGALKGLFSDILRLCKEAGLVKVGLVALDGTKVAVDTALEANRTYESIRAEVETMLRDAESKDVEVDQLFGPEHRGDELPGRRSRAIVATGPSSL